MLVLKPAGKEIKIEDLEELLEVLEVVSKALC